MDASYTVPDAMIGPDGEIIIPDATVNRPEGSAGKEGGNTPNGGEALGDGSATLVSIYTPDAAREATDLDFDPTTGVLWVVLREYAPSDPCTESNVASCAALQGSTIEITGPNTAHTDERVEDGRERMAFYAPTKQHRNRTSRRPRRCHSRLPRVCNVPRMAHGQLR